jgi:hypothetical protein
MRAYPVLMGVFFLVFVSFLLYLQTRIDIGDNGTLRGVSDGFVLLGSAVCTLACWLTAIRLYRMKSAAAGLMAGRAWIGWALLGTAALGYSIGQGIWTWYDAHYTSATLPFPAIYDPFYLSVYPLGWVGVALLIPRGGTAAARTRLLLDAGIAVASALAITWYFILGPTLQGLSGSPIEKTVALAYPLGDLSLCVAAALLLFGPSGVGALSGSLGRLAIGVTWLAITDSLYGYLQLQGAYHTGLLQDIGWPMSWLFIGWAALIYPAAIARLTGQRLSDEQMTRATRLTTAGAAIRAITPTLLAVLTCAVLLLEVALRTPPLLIQVVFVCAGLFLLPIIRQALTLVDNLILNERLRRALGQSQQAFQRSQQELMSTSSRAERYDELRAGIEEIQAVHAQLARGDLSARANVRGPLSPVAQSLNLLIERLTRWAQYEQMNRALEHEADQLRLVLDQLSDGRAGPVPTSRNSLSTGNALLSAARLQRQLGIRFERLRETLDQLGRRWRTSIETVQRAREALNDPGAGRQQLQTAHEALLHVELGLVSNQALLQEVWNQAGGYVQGAEAGEPARSPSNYSLFGEQ